MPASATLSVLPRFTGLYLVGPGTKPNTRHRSRSSTDHAIADALSGGGSDARVDVIRGSNPTLAAGTSILCRGQLSDATHPGPVPPRGLGLGAGRVSNPWHLAAGALCAAQHLRVVDRLAANRGEDGGHRRRGEIGRSRSADRCGNCRGAGPGIGAGNGSGLVSAVGGLDQWQCVGSRTRDLREWRTGRRHSGRKQILSRFPAWDVPL